MAYSRKNYKAKAKLITELTYKYYEVGRQDRSLAAVWRRWVYPVYPMCYKTFLKYLHTKQDDGNDNQQLKLF